MFKFVRLVYRHEWQDFLRDRSTFRTMTIMLVVMPILFSYLLGTVENLTHGLKEKDKRLGYVDSPAVQELLPYLHQSGITALPVKALDKSEFAAQKLEALIREKPRDELDAPGRTSFELWTSGSDEKDQASARAIHMLLMNYNQLIGQRRLVLQGVAPSVLEPYAFAFKSLTVDESSGFATLDILISLFGMALFWSTLHLAVDTTAGERERLTLESLFYTAAPRHALALGKWALITTIIFIATWLVGSVFWVLGDVAVFQELLGRTGTFAYQKLLYGLLVFLPMSPTIAAMQLLIGTYATSVKQAQAFNSVTGLMSLPLSFLIFVDQIKIFSWLPIFGQGLAFRTLLHGETIDPMPLIAAEIVTIALGAIMLLIALRRFQQEKMVLGSTG